jgi:hypothetical protein
VPHRLEALVTDKSTVHRFTAAPFACYGRPYQLNAYSGNGPPIANCQWSPFERRKIDSCCQAICIIGKSEPCFALGQAEYGSGECQAKIAAEIPERQVVF